MTRQPHDQLAKQYLEELLSPLGTVEVSREITIAINQLPVTPDTLWLRLLGRGETQRQAVRELLSLPNTDLLRRKVQELLVSWCVSVEIQNLVNQENQELIMNLSQAYLEWKAATLEEGRQEILENLLQAKFGQLDPSLRRIVDALVQLPPSESSRLLLTLSREE